MYKKLYKDLIDQAKLDNRQKNQGIYYESHHIIPDFMFKNRKRTGPKGHLDGNPNHIDNIVLLTFREHLMCHYYLYEIHKNTHYEYSAGSALQFFFIKAGNNHARQLSLTELDAELLDNMENLRVIGIESISRARAGKMPVVDAITRVSIGSINVDHPKILSGEWIHHSKGKPGHKNRKSQKGCLNTNYKGLTEQQRERVFDCISKSIIENHLSSKTLCYNIKKEFIEFKKVSMNWIKHNFGNIQSLVNEYNKNRNETIIYNRYYRSSLQRNMASHCNKQYGWVTNSIKDIRLKLDSIDKFLEINLEYKRGRTK